MIALATRAKDGIVGKKAAKRMGRPPLPEDERLGSVAKFRLSDDQRVFLDDAAEKAGKKFGAFVRDAALERASRVLGKPAP
jgi:hypothetical protein